MRLTTIILAFALSACEPSGDTGAEDTAAEDTGESAEDTGGDAEDTGGDAEDTGGDAEDTGEDTGDTGDTGSTDAEDADGDGYASDVDCDDTSSYVYPGANELCDGQFNDCDDIYYDASSAPDDEQDSDGDGTLDCEP